MTIQLQAQVPQELAKTRLDKALAAMFPEYSRARLQGWIRSGELTVDGKPARQRQKVTGGEQVSIQAADEVTHAAPEQMPLDIQFEDEAIIVLNKPAGLVVHPGAGNPSGTLMNGLLHHDPALAAVPRAGIVHRIDKDTTGLLVVARTPEAHVRLVDALSRHEVEREYDAVVHGVPQMRAGTVDAPIGRHPLRRTKMAVRRDGRSAVTRYRIARELQGHFTLLQCELQTGRTHQIRVHMKHLGHPLLGDPAYGARSRRTNLSPEAAEAVQEFQRQALHARRLSLAHPITGERLSFEADAPADFERLLQALT